MTETETTADGAMSRIKRALDRLGVAVAHLESVGQDRAASLERLSHQLDSSSRHYAEEHHRLNSELAAVRADYEQLQLVSQKASGRVDAAINRLRAVLEA